ncbi:MAG: single-stranded DNA-binding protein [Anaerolineales bacterium]|nr:MAG: single-stranded DNA-binding protein [Anaerolineales bacterium]
MYQSTVVVGHLGRDPEMRYTPDGTPVTSFSVATTRRWTNAEGEPQERTTWFRVTTWRKLAETCNQYLTKGRLVLVEGDVDASAWSDKTSGEARASLELRARIVRFLGGRDERVETAEEAAPGEEEIPF